MCTHLLDSFQKHILVSHCLFYCLLHSLNVVFEYNYYYNVQLRFEICVCLCITIEFGFSGAINFLLFASVVCEWFIN